MASYWSNLTAEGRKRLKGSQFNPNAERGAAVDFIDAHGCQSSLKKGIGEGVGAGIGEKAGAHTEDNPRYSSIEIATGPKTCGTPINFDGLMPLSVAAHIDALVAA